MLEDADLIIGVGLDPVELIPAPWPYAAPVLSLAEWPLADRYFTPAVELVGPLAGLLGYRRRAPPTGPGPTSSRARRLQTDATMRVATGALAPHEVVDATRARASAGTIATRRRRRAHARCDAALGGGRAR